MLCKHKLKDKVWRAFMMYFVMGIFRKEEGKNYIVPKLQVLKDRQLFQHEEFEEFPSFYLQEMVDTPFDILHQKDQQQVIDAYCTLRKGLYVYLVPHTKDVPKALEQLKQKYIEACSQII